MAQESFLTPEGTIDPSRLHELHVTDWYRAMTLAERAVAGRRAASERPLDPHTAERAAKRLQTWRAQIPFDTDSVFAQRLAVDGLTEESFCDLLGEPIEALHDRVARVAEYPSWLIRIAQAFSDPVDEQTAALPLPDEMLREPTIGFLNVAAPLIRQARARLRAKIETLRHAHPDVPLDPDALETRLLLDLPWPLLQRLSRTLVLQLHVARLRGELEGETSEERFAQFVERLRRPEIALALLRDYPVLARQVVLCLDHWVEAESEFLRHLCEDRDAIREQLAGGDDPGPLVEVEGGAGDAHRGGRSVRIVRFQSGLRLVYKPRSLAVDIHFQNLLAWLNARGDHPPFRLLTLLDRGDHGWVEFVEKKGCADTDELRRFYERQGGYLALLYVLEATDFHYENLIASGENPILVDLESLFHPRSRRRLPERPDLRMAGEVTINSVLHVGLLPLRMGATEEYEGVDLSGLGSVEGQLTPDRVLQWEHIGTDEMRAMSRQMPMEGSAHRPTLDGAEVNVLDYADAIVTGFTRLYRLLEKHRDDLLSDSGPLARFEEAPVRAIVRNTRGYFLLLQESLHPDVLRDALDRDRFLDKLWVGIEDNPYLARTISAEKDALLQGDVPLFTTRPGSRDIRTDTGVQIPDFYDRSGMAAVHERLRLLGEHDLERQLWFVRASLITLTFSLDEWKWPRYRLIEPTAAVDRAAMQEELIKVARALGDRLETLAVRDERDVTWIGLAFRNTLWSVVPLGSDLYGGVPGVVLFLAYLGARTGESRYTTLAQAAWETLRRCVAQSADSITTIGAFDGWGSLVYTLAHLAVLWNDPTLLTEAEEIVERLPDRIDRDEDLDIVGGAAGCIGSLLSLYRCRPSPQVLEAAHQCGERLLARAMPVGEGIGWMTRLAEEKPLTGFSHGTAGIAWALLELAAVTGDSRFRKAGLDAIAYERGCFFPEEGNWLDVHDPDVSGRPRKEGEKALSVAWCYGAPGIGLTRARALRCVTGESVRASIREELDAALDTTLRKGFGFNHCLCHGDVGNLELLIQARETLNPAECDRQAQRHIAMILTGIRQNGWLCGTPMGVESPALMNGLAGIGYGLLRLAEPGHVPSVLLLEPPLGK